MAKPLSSQHFTVISSFIGFVHPNRLKGKPFDHSAARADRVSLCSHQKHLCVLEENVMEGLSVSVVTVANRHCEIESRSTIAP